VCFQFFFRNIYMYVLIDLNHICSVLPIFSSRSIYLISRKQIDAWLYCVRTILAMFMFGKLF
jgi:hypothetical protein